jgi:MFS family permease
VRGGRDFRLLLAATIASGIGSWLAYVALVVDVTDRTDDARWIGVLLLAEFLPSVVFGFVAGPLLDRLPRRGILVGADLARAGIFLCLPFAPSALAVVGLALGAGIATSFFRPAVYASVPNVVEPEDLPAANGLLQTADNLTSAGGALAGGVLVALFGPDPAYVVNTASFVVSALLLLRIRRPLQEAAVATAGHLRDLAAGISVVVHSRPLLTVLAAWSVVMLGSAAVNVAEVFLARDVFGSGDFGYGLLVASGAVGLAAGSLSGGGLVAAYGVRGPYTVAIAVMGAGLAAASVAPNVWVASACAVVAGAGNGAAVVCNAVLVQRGSPDALRGRAFAVLMSVGNAVLGVGLVLAGIFTEVFGARAAWAAAGGLCALGALVAALMLARDDRAAVPVAAGGAS